MSFVPLWFGSRCIFLEACLFDLPLVVTLQKLLSLGFFRDSSVSNVEIDELKLWFIVFLRSITSSSHKSPLEYNTIVVFPLHRFNFKRFQVALANEMFPSSSSCTTSFSNVSDENRHPLSWGTRYRWDIGGTSRKDIVTKNVVDHHLRRMSF